MLGEAGCAKTSFPFRTPSAVPRRLPLLLSCLLFTTCAEPGGGEPPAIILSAAGPAAATARAGRVSWNRDEWGHRPGPRGFRTVILDAGHGGHDSGAISRSTGQREKDAALDTVERIASELRGKVEVVLMRANDQFIDLDLRAARASQRDGAILVSIHYNSGASGARGSETYWWRVDSFGLARRCQSAMTGVSGVGGPAGVKRRRLRLTRNPEVPSVLLELGYLSHPAEAARIADPAYRQDLAEAIARAILAQRSQGDPPGPLATPINAPPSRPTDPPGS